MLKSKLSIYFSSYEKEKQHILIILFEISMKSFNNLSIFYYSGQTKQTTTDANGGISDADRQWLANNGGALPISQVPAQDKALVGTGTGAAAHMVGDTHQIGTKPLNNRPPGSFNPNTGSVSDQ